MNRYAPSTRLVAIPIVAAGLLLGAGTTGAYQDETPVVPVETSVPPVVDEAPAPDPVIEPPAPPVVAETPDPEVVETPAPPADGETPDPDLVVEPPEPGIETEVPNEPDVIAVSGAGRAGGEPSAEEDASITAAAAPQPSTNGEETAKPLPRGRVSVRNVRSNVDVAAGSNPAAPASDPDPAALPVEAVAGGMVAQRATIAGVVPPEPVTNPSVDVTLAASAPRSAVGVPAAASAARSTVGMPATGTVSSAGVTALPATGVGLSNGSGAVPPLLAVLAGALLLGARRLRRGRPA